LIFIYDRVIIGHSGIQFRMRLLPFIYD